VFEQEIVPVLTSYPDVNLKWQGLMFNGYDVWYLDSVAELWNQPINLNIALVSLFRKLTQDACFSAELCKLCENRHGAWFANGYYVHLKIYALCIQILLEHWVKLLEGFPIIVTVGNEVDFRFLYAALLDMPHHLL